MQTVLIVEDDNDIREGLREILEWDGYAVEAARDGLDAMTRLATLPELPCVILTDLSMPVMNGWDLLAALARSERWAGIPRVVLTAHDGPLGIGDTLTFRKPIDCAALLSGLRACSGRPQYEPAEDPA